MKKISPKVTTSRDLGLPEIEASARTGMWGSIRETFKGIFMLFTMPV